MSESFLFSNELSNYVDAHWLDEHPALTELRAITSKLENRGMQIGADQGQFLGLLIKILGAKRCLEVGVFTGYSSTVVALALPEDGQIVACDINPDTTAIARETWEKAGVAHKISLILGPGVETLDQLLASGEAGGFDFAFIDADKPNYLPYYERVLKLLRPGGVIALDNVLWHGEVANPAAHDEGVEAIRAINAAIANDQRVDICLVPIGDGVTLARKKE